MTEAAPRMSRPVLAAPAAVLLVAWLLLGSGLAFSNGHYHHRSLGLVLLAYLAVISALVVHRLRVPTLDALPYLGAALGGALAAAVAYQAGIYGSGPELSAARAFTVVGGVLALGALVANARVATMAGLLGGVTLTAGSALMVRASPRPAIDVWFILTQGAERTVDGANVYTQCWTGSTDPLTDCVFPYLPGQVLMDIPFEALGDVRYASVAALAVSALLVYKINAGRWAPALAALVLLQPKQLFLVEQAWTEPLLLAGMCAMVWGVLTGRGWVGMLGFALALAAKQHMLLLVPLAAWWPAFGIRRTAVSVGAAAMVALPWFLTAPAAFIDDALWFNLELTPRADSLSLYSYALEHGIEPHFALVALLTLGAMAVALAALPRSDGGFLLGSLLVLMTFTVVNKQSFFNHYSLIVGLLVLTVAVVGRAPVEEAASAESLAPGAPADSAGAGNTQCR